MDQDELILRPKRLKGEDGSRVFSVRLPEDTVTAIEELSRHTGHSRNELIGILLKYGLEHCRIEEEL